MTPYRCVRVFGDAPGVGGNPAPVVLDAAGMTDDAMHALARDTGLESVFVERLADGPFVYRFRFWTPAHEMTMCGHGTLGAVWLLAQAGMLPADAVTITTQAGSLSARVERNHGQTVAISQEAGHVAPLPEHAAAGVLAALGIDADAVVAGSLVNAATSRTKTLVRLASPAALDVLRPDFARMQAACDAARSTGLYPYAIEDAATARYQARQFPRASGFPEDAATGTAAAALAYALLADGAIAGGATVTVRQGIAMGSPSRIEVRIEPDAKRCWLGGHVEEI